MDNETDKIYNLNMDNFASRQLFMTVHNSDNTNVDTELSLNKDEAVDIIVGGTSFSTKISTMKSITGSTLASLTKTSAEFCPQKQAYCFDRDPAAFKYILNAHRERELHVPSDTCAITFRKEMKFWGIPHRLLAPCCWKQFYSIDEDLDTIHTLLQGTSSVKPIAQVDVVRDKEKIIRNKDHSLLNQTIETTKPSSKLWLFLEEPTSSTAAKIWCFVYILVVIISVVTFTIWLEPVMRVESYLPTVSDKLPPPRGSAVIAGAPTLQQGSANSASPGTNANNASPGSNTNNASPGSNANNASPGSNANNASPGSNTNNASPGSNTNSEENVPLNEKLVYLGYTDPHPVLFTVDTCCTFFFIIETLVHFCACPHKLRYPRDPYNVMRMFLGITMSLALFLELRKDLVTSPGMGKACIAIKGLNILRLTLIFRLRKLYNGLHIMLLSLERSAKEFLLLMFVFMITVIIYGGMIFCMEIDTDAFPDTMTSMWWAIITMTTVGYGDFYPSHLLGYAVGMLCAINGLIVLALPVAAIASNFSGLYCRNAEIQRHTAAVKNDEENSKESASNI